MRVVRVLVYDGPELLVREHLEKCGISPDRPRPHSGPAGGVSIREVFRGQMAEEGSVFFMEPEKELIHDEGPPDPVVYEKLSAGCLAEPEPDRRSDPEKRRLHDIVMSGNRQPDSNEPTKGS